MFLISGLYKYNNSPNIVPIIIRTVIILKTISYIKIKYNFFILLYYLFFCHIFLVKNDFEIQDDNL
jgi:hypothetical protein